MSGLKKMAINKEYIEVVHSNEEIVFKIEEKKLDNSTKSTMDLIGISDRAFFTKYMTEWITYFFTKKYIFFRQTASSGDTNLPIIMYWKMLSHIANVSNDIAKQANTMFKKIGDKRWKLLSISDKPLVMTESGDIVDIAAGPSIELAFSFGESSPKVLVSIFKNKLVYTDSTGTVLSNSDMTSLLSTKTDTGEVIEDAKIKEAMATYSPNIFSKLTSEGLKKYLNITDTTGMIDSEKSLAPIDISALKIKSNRMKESLKSLLTNRVTVTHHNMYFGTLKNVSYYEAIHNAVIEIHDTLTGNLIDRLYIVKNYAIFESSFTSSKYGNLLRDEVVNDENIYVGYTVYDPYGDCFYYTVYDKDGTNLNIQKYGSVQFKLSWFLNNI